MHRLEQLSLFSERITELKLQEGQISLKHFSFYGGNLRDITLSSDMVQSHELELTRNRIETLVIPEGVGTNTEFPPTFSCGKIRSGQSRLLLSGAMESMPIELFFELAEQFLIDQGIFNSLFRGSLGPLS